MKTTLYFFIVGLLLSCSPQVPGSKISYSLKTLTKDFKFVLETKDEKVIGFESSIIKEKISLTGSGEDNRILTAFPEENTDWTYLQKTNIHFTKVIMAPYYGLFVYYTLQDLRRNNYGSIIPDCPVTTKYLVIFFHDQPDYPILGCAVKI